MDYESIKKRRMESLVRLSSKVNGRHDFKLPLSEVAPSIDIVTFSGGIRFVDKLNPVYEGGSDLAYDFNTLCDEGYIQRVHLDVERDSHGGMVFKTPGVSLTLEGLAAVASASKTAQPLLLRIKTVSRELRDNEDFVKNVALCSILTRLLNEVDEVEDLELSDAVEFERIRSNFNILKTSADKTLLFDLPRIIDRALEKGNSVQRLKSEKFGILDSPKLFESDISNPPGTLGMACIFSDIDGFKALNSRLSHVVVDRDILEPYQRLLDATVSGIGFAYAEGGDETVVLLPNASLGMAISYVEAFRQKLAGHLFQSGDIKEQLKVSVGIAHSEKSEGVRELKSLANQAMLQAKVLGKDRICIHTADGVKAAAISLVLC